MFQRFEESQNKISLRNKLIILIVVAVLPFFVMSVYLLISLKGYSESYDSIVSNMMIANNYNLDFKDELDESIYRLVAGSITLDDIESDATVQDPYELLQTLRTDFRDLVNITTDRESRLWLQSLLRNLDTLEDRIDDIRDNLDEGGHYDENMEMLDNNIYILTELIQDDIQYYIYYQTKSMNSLKLQLNAQVEQFTIVFGVMLAVLALLVALLSAQTLHGIVGPIEELRHVTNEVAHGDFNARAKVQGPAELAELSGSINDMTVHLSAMVQKIKEDERKMRHAELRLLQEQINPHFLYNTLDTIVWLIEGNSADEAVDMVVTLSEFFRLVLSHGAETISIRDEEQHIRSYLKIQQARYHDILDYEIDIDPQLYPYQIQKLTLQPLVENALYHGIKYKRAMGKITITGRMQERRILLTVEDNGVGMEPEKLAELRREIERPCKETETGFGLANVNERIRIYYGEYYGMQIDSAPGEGTRVTVVIPARRIPEKNRQAGNL
jgi:two-component system sensor histidine kinase YesM